MLKLKGILQAPDGWILRWDLTITPQSITLTNPIGILDSNTSGDIDLEYLKRQVTKFLGQHIYTQPNLC